MLAKNACMALGLAALIVVAPRLLAAEDKVEGDLKKLQGTWTSVSGDGSGKITYTIQGKKFKLEAPSRSYEMTLILDEKAKPDKTIDFQIDEGPEDAKGKTSKGIYKLEGDDKFIYCFAPMGDRPTKFETEGYEKIVMTLTREKDKK
jgi:uncharacterized protein (TIGR03067 family)